MDPESKRRPAELVITTIELLEIVLSFLSPRSIQRAKLVCRTWHELIERSRHIQRALVARPIDFMFSMQVHAGLGSFRTNHVPCYPSSLGMKLHPFFDIGSWNHRQDMTSYYTHDRPEYNPAAFATDPPCVAIGMRTHHRRVPDMDLELDCVVYSPRGVLVQDFWHVEDRLEKQERGYIVGCPVAFVVFRREDDLIVDAGGRDIFPLDEELPEGYNSDVDQFRGSTESLQEPS
jgi:hypothetical protein